MSEWQPIDTAPKDGTAFLGLDNGVIAQMAWTSHYGPGSVTWRLTELVWPDESTMATPTHWMPLPPLPETP